MGVHAGPRVDLHSHTNLSDGQLPPRELVQAAARAGVEVFAVTDHDTTEGIPDALGEAGRVGIRLIPGLEISSHVGQRTVHILAYFSAPSLPRLKAWQEARRETRRKRLERIIERLARLGVPVDRAAVDAGADPRRTPGRPHVARALVSAGHVGSLQEAFDRYLGDGRPAYVAERGPRAADAIVLVHDLPGLAVVAHPAFGDVDPVLEHLASVGLDGIEAYHGGHAPETAAYFHERARRLELLVTGGSDYHGAPPELSGRECGPELGRVDLPPDEWQRFDEALARATGMGEAHR